MLGKYALCNDSLLLILLYITLRTLTTTIWNDLDIFMILMLHGTQTLIRHRCLKLRISGHEYQDVVNALRFINRHGNFTTRHHNLSCAFIEVSLMVYSDNHCSSCSTGAILRCMWTTMHAVAPRHPELHENTNEIGS